MVLDLVLVGDQRRPIGVEVPREPNSFDTIGFETRSFPSACLTVLLDRVAGFRFRVDESPVGRHRPCHVGVAKSRVELVVQVPGGALEIRFNTGGETPDLQRGSVAKGPHSNGLGIEPAPLGRPEIPDLQSPRMECDQTVGQGDSRTDKLNVAAWQGPEQSRRPQDVLDRAPAIAAGDVHAGGRAGVVEGIRTVRKVRLNPALESSHAQEVFVAQ